jgi:hypothetical protein
MSISLAMTSHLMLRLERGCTERTPSREEERCWSHRDAEAVALAFFQGCFVEDGVDGS